MFRFVTIAEKCWGPMVSPPTGSILGRGSDSSTEKWNCLKFKIETAQEKQIQRVGEKLMFYLSVLAKMRKVLFLKHTVFDTFLAIFRGFSS
jgi:hypothetical protein